MVFYVLFIVDSDDNKIKTSSACSTLYGTDLLYLLIIFMRVCRDRDITNAIPSVEFCTWYWRGIILRVHHVSIWAERVVLILLL